MSIGPYRFNRSISGRDRVKITCPCCREVFQMTAGRFADRRKAVGDRPIFCSRSCFKTADEARKRTATQHVET